jgi:hypothetical protein
MSHYFLQLLTLYRFTRQEVDAVDIYNATNYTRGSALVMYITNIYPNISNVTLNVTKC